MMDSLACPACKGLLSRAALTSGSPQPCPLCHALLHVEFFPAADIPPPPRQLGEPLTTGEEAACFHHPDRKASNLCAACGRFLCRLCDFEVEDAHYCAACLEQKRKEGLEPRWVTSRLTYDELALTLAVLAWLGLVFLSPVALVVAWRFRKAPPGLTQRRNWRIPLALALATLHLLALVLLVILIVVN